MPLPAAGRPLWPDTSVTSTRLLAAIDGLVRDVRPHRVVSEVRELLDRVPAESLEHNPVAVLNAKCPYLFT